MRNESVQRLVEQLRAELPLDSVLLEPADLRPYQTGARHGEGLAALVVRPSTVEHVRIAVRACLANGIQLIPQSGNTGLVGASIPDATGGQALLSLERLRSDVQVDQVNRSVSCPAGMRLSELNEQLAAYDLEFPIDLGADPMVGGMVATNTGGTRFIKYGDVRTNVLGLEIVLADDNATVLNLLCDVRKNNVGPDLKQLFIGTGGAYGIVTRAVLNTVYRPRQRETAFLVPRNQDSLPQLVEKLEGTFGEMVSAIEGISRSAVDFALSHQPSLTNPFRSANDATYVVLFELSTRLPREVCNLEDVLAVGLESIMESDLIADALLGKFKQSWELRHCLSEGLKAAGRILAFDISLPKSQVSAFRTRALALASDTLPQATVADFGHLGDGGVHFNLVLPRAGGGAPERRVEALRQALYELVVVEFGGSFSAEHGIGPSNFDYYTRYRPTRQRSVDARLLLALGSMPLGRVVFGKPA